MTDPLDPDPLDPDPLDTDPLDTEGPAAPPRANGELVFTAPWQSRLFGATMQLRQSGQLDWDRFRDGLITQIGRHERDLEADPDRSLDDYDYWGCWQLALEDVVAEVGLVDPGELAERSTVLAARPAGHDHGHSHDHEHSHEHDHRH